MAAATALHGEPASKVEQLAGELNHSNNRTVDAPQAPPDNRGESDELFFSRRPSINERTRLPFPNEFAPGVLEPGRGAFVHVLLVTRDPKTNAPGTRARAILYSDMGGRA
jgi:hypothetical protein